MNRILDFKFAKLRDILESLDSVIIAYSGGVDSTFLTKVASDILGDRSIAVTAISETYPERELNEAVRIAKTIGVNHLVIQSEELTNPLFAANPQDRCFHCKSELFAKLKAIQVEKGFSTIVDGANLDDLQDYRPGHRAKEAFSVRSPLLEAELTKEEIRVLSQKLGLETWDKPALACLSSRIPYGEVISPEKLKRIDQAENFLRDLGFKELRVRYHHQIARIELNRKDFTKLNNQRIDDIVNRLKNLGFTYVTLDLQGLRSGSMNEGRKEHKND